MKYLTYKTPDAIYEKCYLEKGEYLHGGKMSLLLVDEIEGPIADITVNIPDKNLPQGHHAIKNYSGNEGMLEWLKENDLAQPLYSYRYNYVIIPVVVFNMEKVAEYIKE